MADMEKVFKALKCCGIDECDSCPYFRSCDEDDLGTCRATLHRDALSLLKAKEPRVMTLTETKTMNAPVFFETKGGVIYGWVMRCNANEKYVFFVIRNGTIQTYRVDRYGISWRCWTSRPTDAQREAVKWE